MRRSTIGARRRHGDAPGRHPPRAVRRVGDGAGSVVSRHGSASGTPSNLASVVHETAAWSRFRHIKPAHPDQADTACADLEPLADAVLAMRRRPAASTRTWRPPTAARREMRIEMNVDAASRAETDARATAQLRPGKLAIVNRKGLQRPGGPAQGSVQTVERFDRKVPMIPTLRRRRSAGARSWAS